MDKKTVVLSGMAMLALSACGGGAPAAKATVTETVTTTLTVTTPAGDSTAPTPAATAVDSASQESSLPTDSTESAGTDTPSASASDETTGDAAGTTHEMRWNQPVTTPLGNQISVRLGKKAHDLSGKPCQYVVLTVKNGTKQTWDPGMVDVSAYTEQSDKAESTPAEGQKVITDSLDPGDTAWGQWCYTSSGPIDHAKVTNADDVYIWHR